MGTTVVALCACTLADYSAGGVQTPLIGDIVTWSATGDFYVKRCAAAVAAGMGRVSKIEVAPLGTAPGYLAVEWLDVERFVSLNVLQLSNVTRGNRITKNGADTVAEDWQAPAATGSQWLAVAKSAASGAGTCLAAILA